MTAFQPLHLPNGTVIPNRIAKAAMEENLADASQGPSAELLRLYQAWAEGGAGLLITGNVMVDRRAMTGPGGVVLEDERQLDKFCEWARISRAQGGQVWMQINHPGRQMQANLGQQTVAPSAVALDYRVAEALGFRFAKRATRIGIGDVMMQFTFLFIVASAILKFTYKGRLQAEVQGMSGVTPYAWWAGRWGLWPLIGFGALWVCATAIWGQRRSDRVGI